MENRTFSIGAVLKKGWEKFKEHPFTWLGALILIFVIIGTHPYVANLIMGKSFPWVWDDLQNPETWKSTDEQVNLLLSLVSLLYFIIWQGLSLGIINMALRANDGLSLNIFHLFSRFHYVFHYIIANFFYVLMNTVGLILFVFPAAIWASKFSLFPYFIVDKGVGPFKALKMSSEATMGFKWDVFAFIIISFLIYIVGAIPLLLGLLVTTPIITVAWAAIYRKLTAREESAIVPIAPVTEI